MWSGFEILSSEPPTPLKGIWNETPHTVSGHILIKETVDIKTHNSLSVAFKTSI